MSAPLASLVAIALMISCGVYLVLERSLTRMLLGVLLISNAVNLLILVGAGPPGNPPVRGRTTALGRESIADPLAQAMILTAIVITMGVAAFMLALAYRSYQLTAAEEVERDAEDLRVAQQSGDENSDILTPRLPHDPDEPAELDELPESEHEK